MYSFSFTASQLVLIFLVMITSGVEKRLRDKEKESEFSLLASYEVATGTKIIGTSATFLNPTHLSVHLELISPKDMFFKNGMMENN